MTAGEIKTLFNECTFPSLFFFWFLGTGEALGADCQNLLQLNACCKQFSLNSLPMNACAGTAGELMSLDRERNRSFNSLGN